MEHHVFLLSTDPNAPCQDVIHSRDTPLKVKVFCVTEKNYTPNPNEIQLFGYAYKKLYAFETMNISPDDALDVISAIQWYADYIEFPDMEILPQDPRIGHSVAI
ncbi:hypothetical protein ACFQ3S_09805 [Mucilaginibacter terrae]|uniref:hypothetical protein n=1 Tax=Mucilaginibacter terrae TaxID=1955052 RepID=UPI0036389400